MTIRWPRGRDERRAEYARVVPEILAEAEGRDARLRLWHERTGLAQSAFYAHKAEVEAGAV